MENIPVIEMKNITKVFSGTRALNDVSVHMDRGEVVGLVGENGAGKSTLMKILNGVYPPTSGEIYINGKQQDFRSTRQAHDAGISMIFQELSVFPDFNAIDNVFIAHELSGKSEGMLRNLDKKQMEEETERLFREDLGIEIDIHTPVRNLSLANRQMVEIARSIHSNAAVIVMDEPTEPLEIAEQERLFEIIRKLRDNNQTVIYISHQLGQLKDISDRIYVLRDGNLITEMKADDVSVNDIIESMIGGKQGNQYPDKNTDFGDIILETKNLSKKKAYQDVSIQVKAGEIVGLAGLNGSGKAGLIRALYGAETPDSGEIYIHGGRAELNNPIEAMKHRIGFIGSERKVDGLFSDQSVEWNLTIAAIDKLNPGKLDKKQAKEITDQYIRDLNVKTPGSDFMIGQLSGGNQQKVLVGRWLFFDPDIILVEEPTRGIDVRAKAEIYKFLNECCRKGKAVIVVSSESPELMGICNRILVMYEGNVVAELDGDHTSEAEIAYYTVQETGGKKYVGK
ncbi:MAG: sugar ABC transporter ATP-binding protein [Eubacterium sp.]|nr:sugar ABC transporter ATP-binding protein [Eubacterium sp.]